MKFKTGTKAQSEVITTILLVFLVIAGIAMIMAFVVPFVKNMLDNSCFDYVQKIEIMNNPSYTCYNPSTKVLGLQIGVGDIDGENENQIKGFVIIVEQDGSSESFEIPGSPSVIMNGGVLELPKKNEVRTYNITGINSRPNQTMIYPILINEKKCADVAYTINSIPICK